MNYTDQARVEGFIQRELTDSEATIFNDLVASISDDIASYTGRQWLDIGESESGEDPSIRYFDGQHSREIFIDDYTALTSIIFLDSQGTTSETLDDADNWIMYPPNKVAKTSIRLRSGCFPTGIGNIKITATWGSGPVPADVTMVATALVGKSLQKNSALIDGKKSESIEGYSVTYLSTAEIDGDVETIRKSLDKYKKFVL